MLSQCELNFGKTSKSRKNNYNFKTRYSKRYTKRSGKINHWTKSSFNSISLENILQNNIAKSLADSFIPKNVEDEPLYVKYSKIKHELKKREERIKEELQDIRGALKQSLEESLLTSNISQWNANVPVLGCSNNTEFALQEVGENDLVVEKPNSTITFLRNSSVCIVSKENSIDNVMSTNTVSVQCVTEKESKIDGIHISATTEKCGDFEIKTEHPAGSIKTYIMHSSSGNIEIVTHIEDFNEKPVQMVRSELYSAVPHLVVPPTSMSTTDVMTEETVFQEEENSKSSVYEITVTKPQQEVILSKTPSMKEVKMNNVYDNVTKVLQKLNDSVVYALDQINKNISKALDSLNQNIKLALTVVVRDEIRKVITEHLGEKKTLVCRSTSHDNLDSSNTDTQEIVESEEKSEDDVCCVADASYNENVVEDLKTITCSATITVSSFVSNKLTEGSSENVSELFKNTSVQTTAINSKVEYSTASTITIENMLEVRETKKYVPKSTSTTEFGADPPPSEPLQQKDFKKTVETNRELKPVVSTKRKVRSTKLTKPTNQEHSIFVATIGNEVVIPSKAMLINTEIKKQDSEMLNAQSMSSNEIPVIIHKETSVMSSSSTMAKDECYMSDVLKNYTSKTEPSSRCGRSKYFVPSLGLETKPIGRASSKESIATFCSMPNSIYSTASSCVVTQVLTEELTNRNFDQKLSTTICNSDQSDDTFVTTSNLYCISEKNILRTTKSKTEARLRNNSVSTDSETYENRTRRKRRKHTKCKISRCVESLHSVHGKVQKPTDSRVVTKQNVQKQLAECQDVNQQMEVSKPHSRGCDCFNCVYAEYCKTNKRNIDNAKIEERYNLLSQKIYDQDTEKNFGHHEKVISKFEEKIEEVCRRSSISKINKFQQKSSFESTLSGLQRALHSLKSRLHENDERIRNGKEAAVQQTTNFYTRLDTTVTLQTNDVQVDDDDNGKRSVGVQRKLSSKREDIKKSKKHIDSRRKRAITVNTMKLEQSKKNLRNLIQNTISNTTPMPTRAKTKQQKTTSFTQTLSRQQELMCIRSCEQELKNFLSTKKNKFQNTYSYKKSASVPQHATQKKGDKKETKRKPSSKSVLRSSTETTIRSSTTSKPEKRNVPSPIKEENLDKRNKRKMKDFKIRR